MHSVQRISAMEKGQCPTVANWEGGGNVTVRPRKGTPTSTTTTPGQVVRYKLLFKITFFEL